MEIIRSQKCANPLKVLKKISAKISIQEKSSYFFDGISLNHIDISTRSNSKKLTCKMVEKNSSLCIIADTPINQMAILAQKFTQKTQTLTTVANNGNGGGTTFCKIKKLPSRNLWLLKIWFRVIIFAI